MSNVVEIPSSLDFEGKRLVLDMLGTTIWLDGENVEVTAYSLSQLKEPLSNMKGELRRIKGVGEAAETIILEIVGTGSSFYYEQLMS